MSEPANPSEVSEGVWPPPPANPLGVEVSPTPLLAFRPVQRLGRALCTLLVVDCGLSAAAGLCAALLPTSTDRAIASSVLTPLLALWLLVEGVCFLVWLYRLARNLRAFGAERLKFTPGWAVIYFFIPILNLYQPYQIFTEVWQASSLDPAARTRAGRQSVHPPALLGVWWGCWLLWALVYRLASLDPASAASNAAAASPFRFVAAILCLCMVRLYTRRQQTTARHLSLIP